PPGRRRVVGRDGKPLAEDRETKTIRRPSGDQLGPSTTRVPRRDSRIRTRFVLTSSSASSENGARRGFGAVSRAQAPSASGASAPTASKKAEEQTLRSL